MSRKPRAMVWVLVAFIPWILYWASPDTISGRLPLALDSLGPWRSTPTVCPGAGVEAVVISGILAADAIRANRMVR